MSSKQRNKLFLTGASGLLGRAIYVKFVSAGWDVFGVALKRAQNNLHKLDITNEADVIKVIEDVQPDIVIHSAAQRFPDKVDSDPEAAKLINVKATSYISNAAAKIQVPVIYISTDYVFDGKLNNPYRINDNPNPLNLYGKTKLEGELATLKFPGNLVLRVPVLYGPVMSLNESAVTCLLEPLLQIEKQSKVSNLERRCPSHVDDIAVVCLQLANVCLKDNTVNGIFHWCGKEKLTKYEMVLKMADVFQLPHSHIKAEVTASSSVNRPLDTELDRSRLEQMGLGQHTPFDKGIYNVLLPWISSKVF